MVEERVAKVCVWLVDIDIAARVSFPGDRVGMLDGGVIVPWVRVRCCSLGPVRMSWQCRARTLVGEREGLCRVTSFEPN